MLDDVEQRLVGVLEKKELECDGEVLRMKQSMEALNIEKRGLLTQLHSMNHKLKAFESRMGRMREQNHLDSSILTHKHDVEQSVKAQLQLQHQRELRAEQEQVAALQKKVCMCVYVCVRVFVYEVVCIHITLDTYTYLSIRISFWREKRRWQQQK
jgi:hypothetical protein